MFVLTPDRFDAPADHVVRPIRADEWPAAKELRLAALRDPVAHLAFLETYEAAVAPAGRFWRERAAGAAEGVRERQQIVAVAPDGRWVGSVVVLVEEAGAQGALGDVSDVRQGHLVAVYVRPEVRGRGLTERLFAYALEWAWEVAGVERVRLFVDERNGRAEAFYRKFGFVPTGAECSGAGGSGRAGAGVRVQAALGGGGSDREFVVGPAGAGLFAGAEEGQDGEASVRGRARARARARARGEEVRELGERGHRCHVVQDEGEWWVEATGG